MFVLLAIPVTIYEVAMHLEYFSRPALQIHVIRILWMVPIYAIDAWLALRFEVQLILLHKLMLLYKSDLQKMAAIISGFCACMTSSTTGQSHARYNAHADLISS